MPDSIRTDVFKFVAVRPTQLSQDEDTQASMIRDERADTADGRTRLRAIAEPLSQRGGALAAWKGLDLSDLEPLAKQYRRLVQLYDTNPEDQFVDPRTAVSRAGLDNVGEARLQSM